MSEVNRNAHQILLIHFLRDFALTIALIYAREVKSLHLRYQRSLEAIDLGHGGTVASLKP